MVCQRCHTVNADYHQFCHACGQGLARRRPAPAAAAPAPVSDQAREVEKLLEDGFIAVETGDLEAALQLVQSALALEPESLAAHSLLGSIYEHRGQKVEAARQYGIVLSLDPSNKADRQKLAALSDTGSFRRLAPRPARSWAVAAVLALGLALLGGGWWGFQQRSAERPQRTAAAPPPKPSPAAGGRPAVAGVLPRSSPAPQQFAVNPERRRPTRLVFPTPRRQPGSPNPALELPLPPAQVAGVTPLEPAPSGLGKPEPVRPALPATAPDPTPPAARPQPEVQPPATGPGFIRIQPEGEAALTNGAPSAQPGAPARIRIKVKPARSQTSLLAEAKQHQKLGLRAWRQRNLRVAEREYLYAQRLFRSLRTRGGAPAREATTRLRTISEMLDLIRQRA